VAATKKLLHRLRLQLTDIDVVELKRGVRLAIPGSVASVWTAGRRSARQRAGGAIALGHPLGAERRTDGDYVASSVGAPPPRRALWHHVYWGRPSIAMVIERVT